MDEDQNTAKAVYLDTFIEMLGQILGWTPEQVLRWVDQRFGENLDDPRSLFYHRMAVEWAIQKIVPELLQSEYDELDSIKLRHKIEAAFREEYPRFDFPQGAVPRGA